MAGPSKSDEFRNFLQILSINVAVSSRYRGYSANSKLKQPLATAGIVEDVDRNEIDAIARKKLFRS